MLDPSLGCNPYCLQLCELAGVPQTEKAFDRSRAPLDCESAELGCENRSPRPSTARSARNRTSPAPVAVNGAAWVPRPGMESRPSRLLRTKLSTWAVSWPGFSRPQQQRVRNYNGDGALAPTGFLCKGPSRSCTVGSPTR